MKRKRGERNWHQDVEDYTLNLPTKNTLEHTKHAFRLRTGIIMIHGHEYILATDGKLEKVDEP